jgi:hypothetical protein
VFIWQVKALLDEPRHRPVKDSGYLWADLLDRQWPQLSGENCAVEITPADERGLNVREAWRIRVLAETAPQSNGTAERLVLDRKNYLRWVEDRIRAQSYFNFDRERVHFLRWLAVFEARQKGLSWKEAPKAASEQLKKTSAAGEPDTMKRSYNKVQRMRDKVQRKRSKAPG